MRLMSISFGGFCGFVMGMTFYLVPTKLLLTEALPAGIMLPPGVQQRILEEALRTGGMTGLYIGLFFGLIAAIPRPPIRLTSMIGSISLIVTWIIAFVRHGSHLKDFTLVHGGIFALWLLLTLFIFLPVLSVVLGKFEPRGLLDLPAPPER